MMANNMEGWISGNAKHGVTNDGSIYECPRMHAELFDNLRLNTMEAFTAIHDALREQELAMLEKFNQFQVQQAAMLTTCRPSADGLQEFQQNVKKINAKAFVLREHAPNLTHIKLTLARLASLVSLEGDVAKLVTPAPSARERLQLSPHYENAWHPVTPPQLRADHCVQHNTVPRVCEIGPQTYPSILDYKSPQTYPSILDYQSPLPFEQVSRMVLKKNEKCCFLSICCKKKTFVGEPCFRADQT